MHDPLPTTSENPLEAEENTDHDENVLIDEQLTSEDSRATGTIDLCRSDDQIRCGTSSTYICDIQKCDGTKDCPNGEDEENCPTGGISHESDEGSGEDPISKSRTLVPDVENSVEAPAGDFYFLLFPKFYV